MDSKFVINWKVSGEGKPVESGKESVRPGRRRGGYWRQVKSPRPDQSGYTVGAGSDATESASTTSSSVWPQWGGVNKKNRNNTFGASFIGFNMFTLFTDLIWLIE